MKGPIAIMGKQALLLLKKNEESYSIFGASVHWYGKPKIRKKRKMGHIIVVSQSVPIVRNKVSTIIGNEA